MILLDTSAIYALADSADRYHARAERLVTQLYQDGEQLVLHSYVLAEAATLIQRRLGLQRALRFLHQSHEFHLRWITETDHEAGVEILEQEGRRELSLVDCVSFAVMRSAGIDTAFAFDADFERAGFHLYNGSA